MNNSSIKKSHKRLLIVLSLAIITAGGVFMFNMLGKSQEERRNREYEVSLVNALKNSYEGIEEIKISNPEYTSPPGDWSCDVDILFSDRNKEKFVTAILKNENETNTITTSDGQEFRVVATKSHGGTGFDGLVLDTFFFILVLFIFKL